MQQADGTFKILTEVEADELKGEGKGGRILRVGETKHIANKNDGRAKYKIESIGKRFVRVRGLPGTYWSCKVGEEVTIEECAFLVLRVEGKVLLLQGVPPSPTIEDRQNGNPEIEQDDE